MPKNRNIPVLVTVLMGGFFIFGIIHLFLLRFEKGDVYPAYSSLRSDPLGTKAFYKSLENIDAYAVDRNYRPIDQIKWAEKTTFFFVGSRDYQTERVPEPVVENIDELAEKAGRLVLTFHPSGKRRDRKDETGGDGEADETIGRSDEKNKGLKKQAEKEEQSSGEGDKKLHERMLGVKFVSIKDHWGLELDYMEKNVIVDQAVLNPELLLKDFPQSISWHSTLYFKLLSDAWKVIYTCNEKPVMIEREYKNGRIIMAADSYFLSNEALWSERHPGLLAGIAGRNRILLFDESHFGINKVPGVANLIHRYRFHWFFFSIALMMALFVWKNTVYFIPPPPDETLPTRGEGDMKRDQTMGLVSLLRSHIPRARLLRTCLEEWKKSVVLDDKSASNRLDEVMDVIEMEESLDDFQKDPVKGYQIISNILSKSRKER